MKKKILISITALVLLSANAAFADDAKASPPKSAVEIANDARDWDSLSAAEKYDEMQAFKRDAQGKAAIISFGLSALFDRSAKPLLFETKIDWDEKQQLQLVRVALDPSDRNYRVFDGKSKISYSFTNERDAWIFMEELSVKKNATAGGAK